MLSPDLNYEFKQNTTYQDCELCYFRHNSTVGNSVKEDIIGVETHWYHPQSLDFAKKVHAKIASSRNLSKWETKDRGLFQSKFYVINHTNAPAILVEIGFISNPNERRELVKEKRQEEVAKAIADGIMEYLKDRK